MIKGVSDTTPKDVITFTDVVFSNYYQCQHVSSVMSGVCACASWCKSPRKIINAMLETTVKKITKSRVSGNIQCI